MAQLTKEKCARDLMVALDQLRYAYQNFKTTETAYFENGFNSTGADPIADTDLDNLNLLSADVGSAITLLQQFDNLLEGEAVSQASYKTTLAKLKWWAK